jgi:hypothetical protein
MPNSAHSSDESEFVAEEIEEDFDDDHEVGGYPEELRQERLELLQLPSNLQQPSSSLSKRQLSIQEQKEELEKINPKKWRGRYSPITHVRPFHDESPDLSIPKIKPWHPVVIVVVVVVVVG